MLSRVEIVKHCIFLTLQERLKSLYTLVHQIDEERKRNEHNLGSIAKAHEKIHQEEKVSPYYQVRGFVFVELSGTCLGTRLSFVFNQAYTTDR